MAENNMFKRLVFYLEACESGSMFQGILPTGLEIFATTAANADESSWATYCPPSDLINGTEVGSCLGDLYSVNWMENSDAAFVKVETLEKQFDDVVTATSLSHVSQFGDLKFDKDAIGDFQADESQSWMTSLLRWITNLLRDYESESFDTTVESVSWDSRDVKLAYLERIASKTNTLAANDAVEEELAYRSFQDKFFEDLTVGTFGQANPENAAALAMGSFEEINFPCLKQAVSAYENTCSPLGEYGLKYVRVFVNLCNTNFGEQLPSLISQFCPVPAGQTTIVA
jgi:legumain